MRSSMRLGAVVAVILCVTGAVAAFLIAQTSLHSEPEVEVASEPAPGVIVPPQILEQIAESQLPAPVLTDQKRPIRLYRALADDHPPDEAILKIQAQVEQDFHLVRHGPKNEPCNCHGWVFAEGKYWIKPDDVELILKDNGYQIVHEPLAGDLVIYRDSSGYIVHSGVVHKVVRSNEATVESRWGNLGRYFHAPDKQVFSKSFTYYRSARHGHILAGVAHGSGHDSQLFEIEE